MIRTVLLCVLAAAATLPTAVGQLAGVGDPVPDFEFRKLVVNDDGRRSSGEHLGQPVLYEFWGVR